MSNIKDIVNVSIQVTSPAATDDSYNNLLLVVPEAKLSAVINMGSVVEITSEDDLLKFGYATTDDAYIAAQVVFSQNPCPNKVLVTARKTVTQTEDVPVNTESTVFYNGADSQYYTATDYLTDATTVAITNAYYEVVDGTEPYAQFDGTKFVEMSTLPTQSISFTVDEAIANTLSRADTAAGWYGFSLVPYNSAVDISGAASWSESNSKMFGFAYNSDEITTDISEYDHTFAIYYGDTDGDANNANKYSALAWMAKCFTYSPGSETWAFKTIDGAKPSVLTNAKILTLSNENVNYYYEVAKKDITKDGKVGSGEWIDVVRFKDYLLSKIQTNVFNYMTSRAKVPFNDAGITGIQNVIEAILINGQSSGGIDVNRYDDNGTVEAGYTIHVPLASSISAEQRRERKLTGIWFTARLAGAIHYVEIKGTLEY